MSVLALMLQASSIEPLAQDAAVNATELAADPAAASAATTATNHLDIVNLLLHASIPVQFVMLLLLVASIASWVIIFRKRSLLNRAEHEADRFEERFWSGADLSKLYAGASERNRDIGGLEAIFEGGFREFNRIRERRGVDSRIQLEGAQRAMRVSTSRELDGLERNLEFGTVWGIMISFQGLANVKEATIATVAPGISEALIATAMGLFAAIPAVWAYNRFATKVERIGVRYDAFGEEFSSILQRQAHLDE